MKNSYLIILTTVIFCLSVSAQKYSKLEDLSGKWKFSLGDNSEWKMPEFEDDNWTDIFVPSSWEMEGFNGYDGYAWYRRSIVIPNQYKEEALVLDMGYIDDVDEVFVNGIRIGGSGVFPPSYSSAYNAQRLYSIPQNIIRFGADNLIAVRVYDDQMEGGINRGDIGLLADKSPLKPFLNLQGIWKFRTGDNLDWRFEVPQKTDWNEIFVPGDWENQGYKHYDGFGWYEHSFNADQNFSEDRVVLLLGKIDDIDEVFINGIKIGQTGFMSPPSDRDYFGEAYRQLRGYLVPEGLIQIGKLNTIHVRVYDNRMNGGITEGPIGFIHQAKYIEYWRNRKIAGN